MKNKSVKKTMMMNESPSHTAGTAESHDARRRQHQKGNQIVRKKPTNTNVQTGRNTTSTFWIMGTTSNARQALGNKSSTVIMIKDVVHRESP